MAKLPKIKRGFGKPIIVTFDEGVWYWNQILWQLEFIPSGKQKSVFSECIKSEKTNNLKSATIRILQLELLRCKGGLTIYPEGLN